MKKRVYNPPTVSEDNRYTPDNPQVGTRYREAFAALIDLCIDRKIRFRIYPQAANGHEFSVSPLFNRLTLSMVPNSGSTLISFAHEFGHIVTFKGAYSSHMIWKEVIAWGWAWRFLKNHGIEITEEMALNRDLSLEGHRLGEGHPDLEITAQKVREIDDRRDLSMW